MLTEFEQRLSKFLKYEDSIFCVQGLKNGYHQDNRFYVITNPKKFIIDYLICKKPFASKKMIVINYAYGSTENNIIIKEWIKSKKIIIISSFISEYIIMDLQKITDSIDYYIHQPRFPIMVSYHEKYDSIDDIYIFLKGFLLTSDINRNNKAIIFVKNPYWCDEMAKIFSDKYTTISLHGKHLKSQFCPKLFNNISIIFTTNLHHKKHPIQNIQWILDFSDDSKIQMDERKALAGYNMPCYIHYFSRSKDSLNIYPIASYEYDWKELILHGILANNLNQITEWSSTVDYHIESLQLCRILKEDSYKFTNIIKRHPTFFSELLMDCPFKIERYAQITHLYHMTQYCCMSEIMILLTTMCISILDVLQTYGHHSFFIMPKISNMASSSVMKTWKMIIHVISSYQNENNILNMLELLLTIVMTMDKDTYHINNIIWLRFMDRWKYLCSKIGFFQLENNKTVTFHKKIRYLLKKHFSPQYWNLDKDDTFISENVIVIGLMRSRIGIWYPINTPYNDKLSEYMWKLSDFSNLSSIYSCEKKFVLHLGDSYHIDIPLSVHNYLITFEENIKKSSKEMNDLIEERNLHKTLFIQNVVTDINEDVANRPFMCKYIETMQEFYKRIDKSEEESILRKGYLESIEKYYETRNGILMTRYSDYLDSI
jgi:hypothetical protein